MTIKIAEIEEKLSALLDDTDFQHLSGRFNRFNLFVALGATHSELKHSNFIAFLLSPNETHGLGSDILGRALRLLLSKSKEKPHPISSLELQLADLDRTIVERERDNIDILIEVGSLKLIVAVENKIGSSVGDGQLTRYKEIVRQRYIGWHQLYVLLTPEGYDADEYDGDYVACSYSEIVSVLTEYATQHRNSLSSDLALAIDHYVDMARGTIVADEKLRNLARQLYTRHKEAFEFVFSSRPDPLDSIKTRIESMESVTLDRCMPTMLRFAPAEWGAQPLLNSCPHDKWTKTSRNLLFEVKFNKATERVFIALVLGPGDRKLREFIYDSANKSSSTFKNLVKPMGAIYSTIYSRDLLAAAQAESLEPEEKSSIIATNWDIFLNEDLPKLKADVSTIIRRFEKQAEL